MTVEQKIAKTFGLEGDSWQKHANPWSIWTRFATMPFLILSIWSRVWIGWYCLIPITLLIIWLRVNPTLFKKPDSFDNWESKAVFGEKYWAERKKRAVPEHHHNPINILTILQSIGGLLLVYGLWKLDLSITLLAAVLVYMSKMWFLDRMVWVYEDMQTHGGKQKTD